MSHSTHNQERNGSEYSERREQVGEIMTVEMQGLRKAKENGEKGGIVKDNSDVLNLSL